MDKKPDQLIPYIPKWLAFNIEKWIDKKNHNYDSSFFITRHNIYILPTKSGWMFMLTLIAILSGAINYNNSMAYLLCFFLASLGFIAMLQTHQNLNKITITSSHSPAVYCGNPISFIFTLASTEQHKHYAITTAKSDDSFSLDTDKKSEFKIIEKGHKRGQKNPQKFKISSEFPLGLFYAWTQVKITNPVIVYPKPIKNRNILSEYSSGNNTNILLSGDDDYTGIRDFKKGDSPKKLAWKAIAKTNQLFTKEFHTETGDQFLFDYDKLEHIQSTEEKLSILCGLIIAASEQKTNFGLKLPNKTIAPNHGDLHKHNCLTLLALF